MNPLCKPPAGRLEFLWPDRPLFACAERYRGHWETAMLDVIMLACGIGGFAVLFGYVALCERL
jgi:hypothetical protein